MRAMLSSTSFVALSLLPFAVFSAVCAAPSSQTVIYGPAPSPGASQLSTSSAMTPFDGSKFPKTGINATSFDWWYFDAVSSINDKANVVVQFLSTNPSTLGLDADGAFFNWILLSGTFQNGTTWETLIPAKEGVVTTSSRDGSSKGDWKGSGCSWSGSWNKNAGAYSYDVTVKYSGMSGTLKIAGLAPPHYPHSLWSPTAYPQKPITELLRPNFGWSNAIPAGKATVDFTVAGESIKFTGWGYHDKNWGDKPTPKQTKSWYWGHAQLQSNGNQGLSIVWFDYLSKDIAGNNPTAAYLVQQDGSGKNSVISLGNCKVRPFGKGVVYPPKTVFYAQGYTIDVDAGNKGKWSFTASTTTNATDPGQFYSRFTGIVEGGKVGSKQKWKGTGLWEWMYFLD